MRVTISDGNTKIGKIINVSLTPVASCKQGVPCTKKCYALKSYRQYPNVRKAWDQNFKMATNNSLHERASYFNQIREKLDKTKRTLFRWHVAGDIPDQWYLDRMEVIADQYPHIYFKVATKMHHLDYSGLPKNLKVWFSNWPGMPTPYTPLPEGVRQNWLSTDIRKPKRTFKCKEKCDECKYCYKGKGKLDVEFKLH